jgi:hypothetical protein
VAAMGLMEAALLEDEDTDDLMDLCAW